jgi:hypothetical protein
MRRVSWSQAFGRDSPKPNDQSASASDAFGAKKSITYWGGICLLSNNLTGPGMVLLPGLFAGAGLTFPLLVTILISVLSSVSVLFLARMIQSIPGNSDYTQRIEFSKLIRRLFPRWLYVCAFFAMIFNLQVCCFLWCGICVTFNPQAANVGAIIVSAQTMDSTLLAIFKKTCALTMYSPSWASIGPPATAGILDKKNGTMSSPVFQCILNDDNDVKTDSPFGDDYVVSLGFLVVLVLCVPLGYFNLEDNIWVQQFGFFFLVLCLIAWVVQFFHSGMDTSRLGVLVPPPEVTTAYGSVLSVIVFQFNFALYVPSWLIEKRPDVSVAKSVGWAVFISSAMFLLLGIMGALAFEYPGGQDFLAVLSSKKRRDMLPTSLVGAYLFPAAALLTGIPVASIVIRYNLVESKLCSTFHANMSGVVLPWLLALCFFAGSFLNTLIQWTSALVFVALNLVMPVYMYIITHKRDAKSVAPASSAKTGPDYSFQNFGNSMLSPNLGESLLDSEASSINSEQRSTEGVVAVVPEFILKRFKLPRFPAAPLRKP